MRIAINASLAGTRATGIGVYAEALAAALPRVDGGSSSYDIFMGTPARGELARCDTDHVRVHVTGATSASQRMGWDCLRVGLAARAVRADVLHSTTAYLPVWAPCPSVLTVHDLAIYRYPEAFRRFNRTVGVRLFERSVRRASALIAVSRATRDDLVALLGVPAARITVIPEAADPIFQMAPAADTVAAVRARYGLHRPYVLSVATAEPRKNLIRLVEAYASCAATLPDPPLLAVVGAAGWLSERLWGRLRELAAQGRARITGYVPRADLPVLYAGAAAFAYPSLYEGFGLPVLEALACGTPVLTSDRSALPETAGDAALLVDPTSVDALARGLIRLLTDPSLAATLRARGPAQAARFSWEHTARATLAVYRAAVERAVGSVGHAPAVAAGGQR